MALAPHICVVIAAKDAATTIRRSVSSALHQAEVGEVIVVDDASTDATATIATDTDDSSNRLRVIRLDLNGGPSAARNRALKEARAELICVLDADDHLEDGRFNRMLAVGGSNWDFLADDLLLASEASPDVPYGRLVGVPEGVARQLDLVEFVRGNFAAPDRQRREFGYLKPLMRSDFLIRSGLTYDETLRLGEDYVLYAQALARGARFKLIGACGYVAVERSNSLSHQHETADLAALQAAEGRLIEEARTCCPNAVQVLEIHQRGVQHQWRYRLMLDAKKRGDWPQAAAHLLRTPATTAYIMGHTYRAKSRRDQG